MHFLTFSENSIFHSFFRLSLRTLNAAKSNFSSYNLSKSVLDAILGKENPNLKEIKIFIKFKNFEKILKDRERALVDNINVDSKNVACKVSDGINVCVVFWGICVFDFRLNINCLILLRKWKRFPNFSTKSKFSFK